jgi:hypothetical protein
MEIFICKEDYINEKTFSEYKSTNIQDQEDKHLCICLTEEEIKLRS